MAVLGDMLELGPIAAQAHRELGRFIARLGVAYLITVGELAGQIAAEAGQKGVKAVACRDHKEALGEILDLPLQEGWYLLVKGSRGAKMERIVSSFMELFE